MTFWPADFNPRDDVVANLDLAEMDTPDGAVRFIIGTDGVFADSNGDEWIGSSLIGASGLKSAINGIAPAGSVSLSFFQDPNAPDLVEQIRDLGLDYIKGRAIRFYTQPIRSQSEYQAPATPPILWLTRIMRTLSVKASGAQDRVITVGFESWAEHRRSARRIMLNTEGHAILTGSANPSLEFMPTTDTQEESLFG